MFSSESAIARDKVCGRGDTSSTRLGRDTERIRRYIQEQDAEDRRLDQLELPNVTNLKPREAPKR